MYIHVFLHYPHVSLICLSFLYKTTSYAVVESMVDKKTRAFDWYGQSGATPPTTSLTKTTVSSFMQCAIHVPVQPILVECRIFSPTTNTSSQGIAPSRAYHSTVTSDQEVRGIGRRPRGRVASSVSRTYWGRGRLRGWGLSCDDIGLQCSIPKGYCGGRCRWRSGESGVWGGTGG